VKLGLRPPRPGAVRLRLATYLDFSKLPEPPRTFGHYPLIPPDAWGVLANDVYGCCAICGPEHQTLLFCAEGKRPCAFDDAVTLTNYGAITGFTPLDADGNPYPADDNPTDQGTDVGQMADYWMQTGLLDANGVRHKVAAVVDMNPGDLRELWVATYLFQSVGLGFALPDSAMQQTQDGQPWDVVDGASIVGGHYVPCFGRQNGMGIGVTWGVLQPFTTRFYTTYNNQGICALSEEMMIAAKDIDGVDDQLLRADLDALTRV